MTVGKLNPAIIYGSQEHRFEGRVRFKRWHLGSGSTRHVYGLHKWAIKVPNLNKRPTRWRGMFLRGVLANRSEWKQRHRDDVVKPLFTFFWIAQVYPKVDLIPEFMWESWDLCHRPSLIDQGYRYDECKPSSWATVWSPWCGFPSNPARAVNLRLLDYDRCWDEPMGILGKYQEWRDEWINRRQVSDV